jgi:adenosine deaminase
MFHTKEGLSYEEIVESVLEGLNSNNNVKTNLILCMMRGFPKENNLKTIDVAEKYLNKGVCALDLAGAEDKYPLIDYIDLFDIIKEKNIPFTIHAGENGSHKEIDLAIKIGTKRIGHGIHAYENKDTINLLKEKDILLEICPTSNVQTNSVDKYENHPIYNFYKSGLNICINTDNKTVSNISLTDEYIKLHNRFNFNIHDFKIMNVNAIKSTFLTDEEKEKLINEIIYKYINNKKIIISQTKY